MAKYNFLMTQKIILIIEDDNNLREAIRLKLENEDYNIHTAKDGLDGLEKAKIVLPDLILLDVMMPKMDGLEALYHIDKEISKRIPIVIITNKTMLAYLPVKLTVKFRKPAAISYSVRWFDPAKNEYLGGSVTDDGTVLTVTSPSESDMVLILEEALPKQSFRLKNKTL